MVQVKFATHRMVKYIKESLDKGSEILFGTKHSGGIIKEYDARIWKRWVGVRGHVGGPAQVVCHSDGGSLERIGVAGNVESKDAPYRERPPGRERS